MRGNYHILVRNQLLQRFRDGRLCAPYIKSSADNLPGVQVVKHRLLFNNTATSYVQNYHTALHQPELSNPDHSLGFIIERRVDSYNVAIFVNLIM